MSRSILTLASSARRRASSICPALTGLSPAPCSCPFSLNRTQFPSVCFGIPSTRAVTPTSCPPLTNRTASSLNTTVGDDAYFSIDGGVTQLQRFNQGPGGDYADWWSIGAHTPSAQDSFGSSGVEVNHNLAERTALDVVGWNLFSTTNNVPEPAGYLLVLPALLGLSRRQRKAG